MATRNKTSKEYEEEIRNLKLQMDTMEKSKIELMLSTSNEMDRLREYIKFMTGSEPTANKSSFQRYEFPKPPRAPPQPQLAAISQQFSTSQQLSSSIGGVATSAGSAGSAGTESRYDDAYRVYSKSPSMVRSNSATPPGPQLDEMGWTLDETDINGIVGGLDSLHHLNFNEHTDLKSDQRSITSSSYKKARISGQQRQRRGTDYGNTLGLSTAYDNIGNSIMVDAEDMKAAMDLNADIIEEMEAALNQFCELQLFGVVECECAEPKQLQFIATMNTNDDILYECDNCTQSHATIFKCDSCRMSICSKCEKYIAEMQCLRSVMEPFKYAHDFEQHEPMDFGRFHSINWMAHTESVDLKPRDIAGIIELRECALCSDCSP